MKVKKLISELKKMPGDLNVGIAHMDNYAEECAGWADTLMLFDKADFDVDKVYDKRMFQSMPQQCVIIRC